MSKRHAAVVLAAAFAAVTATALPAHAATTYDPNVARVANPASTCKSIPGTIAHDLALFGAPAPDLSWFDYSSCVTTLARGEAYASDINEETGQPYGDPYAQCDLLVSVGAITYPATLHSGEGGAEDAFLPDLTVKNRKECGSALYAFHLIASNLPEPPS